MIYCASFIDTSDAVGKLVKRNLKSGVFFENVPGEDFMYWHAFKQVSEHKFRVRKFIDLKGAANYLSGKEAEYELQS